LRCANDEVIPIQRSKFFAELLRKHNPSVRTEWLPNAKHYSEVELKSIRGALDWLLAFESSVLDGSENSDPNKPVIFDYGKRFARLEKWEGTLPGTQSFDSQAITIYPLKQRTFDAHFDPDTDRLFLTNDECGYVAYTLPLATPSDELPETLVPSLFIDTDSPPSNICTKSIDGRKYVLTIDVHDDNRSKTRQLAVRDYQSGVQKEIHDIPIGLAGSTISLATFDSPNDPRVFISLLESSRSSLSGRTYNLKDKSVETFDTTKIVVAEPSPWWKWSQRASAVYPLNYSADVREAITGGNSDPTLEPISSFLERASLQYRLAQMPQATWTSRNAGGERRLELFESGEDEELINARTHSILLENERMVFATDGFNFKARPWDTDVPLFSTNLPRPQSIGCAQPKSQGSRSRDLGHLLTHRNHSPSRCIGMFVNNAKTWLVIPCIDMVMLVDLKRLNLPKKVDVIWPRALADEAAIAGEKLVAEIKSSTNVTKVLANESPIPFQWDAASQKLSMDIGDDLEGEVSLAIHVGDGEQSLHRQYLISVVSVSTQLPFAAQGMAVDVAETKLAVWANQVQGLSGMDANRSQTDLGTSALTLVRPDLSAIGDILVLPAEIVSVAIGKNTLYVLTHDCNVASLQQMFPEIKINDGVNGSGIVRFDFVNDSMQPRHFASVPGKPQRIRSIDDKVIAVTHYEPSDEKGVEETSDSNFAYAWTQRFRADSLARVDSVDYYHACPDIAGQSEGIKMWDGMVLDVASNTKQYLLELPVELTPGQQLEFQFPSPRRDYFKDRLTAKHSILMDSQMTAWSRKTQSNLKQRYIDISSPFEQPEKSVRMKTFCVGSEEIRSPIAMVNDLLFFANGDRLYRKSLTESLRNDIWKLLPPAGIGLREPAFEFPQKATMELSYSLPGQSDATMIIQAATNAGGDAEPLILDSITGPAGVFQVDTDEWSQALAKHLATLKPFSVPSNSRVTDADPSVQNGNDDLNRDPATDEFPKAEAGDEQYNSEAQRELLKRYFVLIGPAYRKITGKQPRGFPVVLNVTVSYADNGRESRFHHQMLFEVPRGLVQREIETASETP
jgi:hypothetical protein